MGKPISRLLPELLEGVDSVTLERFETLLLQTGASPAYLKKLLRAQSVPLHPFLEGVRQDNRDHLVSTLSRLSELYPLHQRPAREVVLESKRHTRLLLDRNPDDPWRKEVLLHLNTWLENPTIYPLWASLENKNAAHPER